MDHLKLAFTLGADMGPTPQEFVQLVPPGKINPKGKISFLAETRSRGG